VFESAEILRTKGISVCLSQLAHLIQKCKPFVFVLVLHAASKIVSKKQHQLVVIAYHCHRRSIVVAAGAAIVKTYGISISRTAALPALVPIFRIKVVCDQQVSQFLGD
jgi:hypothetical protein